MFIGARIIRYAAQAIACGLARLAFRGLGLLLLRLSRP
jgi:hypothetical protein